MARTVKEEQLIVQQPPRAPAPVVNENLEPVGLKAKRLVGRWHDYLMQYGIEEGIAYDMALDCWRIMKADN